jgi:CRP-like cAMP-binding protein
MKQALRGVRWLASLSEGALDDVIEAGTEVRFVAGKTLIGELESGDELFVLVEGSARATVAAGQATPLQVGTLGPGDTCGELSLVTRELRSATITAETEVRALRIERLDFDELLKRHPQIAAHFAHEVAGRLRDVDAALDGMLERGMEAPAAKKLTGHMAAVTPTRGSFARAWRELVISRSRELPFVALVSFLITLVTIRLLVWVATAAGAPLFLLLRSAYTSGITLVLLSTATALMRFRPSTRRLIAIGCGIGFALIVNELSVFLAFDVFYIDMTTRDPAMVFDVEQLYRRSETEWAVALLALFLIQATYLGRFYRRVGFILGARLRRRV